MGGRRRHFGRSMSVSSVNGHASIFAFEDEPPPPVAPEPAQQQQHLRASEAAHRCGGCCLFLFLLLEAQSRCICNSW